MPRTRECDYCGADIEPGTGTMFVRKNGSTVHFCSSKCENNADLGREARNLEWTAAGRGPEGEAGVEEDVTASQEGAGVEVEGEDVETQSAEDVAEEAEESEAIDPDEDVAAGSEEVEADEAETADEQDAEDAESEAEAASDADEETENDEETEEAEV